VPVFVCLDMSLCVTGAMGGGERSGNNRIDLPPDRDVFHVFIWIAIVN